VFLTYLTDSRDFAPSRYLRQEVPVPSDRKKQQNKKCIHSALSSYVSQNNWFITISSSGDNGKFRRRNVQFQIFEQQLPDIAERGSASAIDSWMRTIEKHHGEVPYIVWQVAEHPSALLSHLL